MVHLWDDEHSYTSFKHKPYAYKKSRDGRYKSIYGDKLERIEKFNPRDPTLFESDVPWDTRVLIDAYSDSDEVSTKHRRAYIDIEVDSVGGYPNIEDPIKEVTAIALLDEVKDTYYCFILDKDGVVQNENKDNTIILPYLHEEDLLVAFLKKWDEVKPTIVSGWNIDGFDFPYLHARLVRVVGEEAANALSPINICYFNKYKNKMCIAGVNALDYLLLYKKYSGKNLTNYRLDTVAKEELKIGKIEYDGSLNDLMKSDIKKFIEYNLHDIILVKKMNDQLQFIELAMSICHVCHVGYEEFGVSSKFLEGALLTYLRRKKLIAPNKKLNVEVSDRDDDLNDDVGFEGAYVKDPIPGRYDWVCSADINSLYPSVIMSLNISPETKVAVIKDWDSEKLVKKSGDKIAFDNEVYTYEDFEKLIVDNNLSVSANGIVYDQNKLGCIPDILKTWFAERLEYKTKMKDASKSGDKAGYVFWKRRQHVQKILLNSLYGVLGLSIFRFYDLDNAAAVTLTGQEIIKTSAKYVNGKFNKRCNTKDKDYVIYIDTDSLYLDIKSLADHEKVVDIKPFAIQTIGNVSKELNEFYKVMMLRMFNSTDNRIVIAADVVAQSAFWVVKKRYAMRKVYNMEESKDMDEIEIKGLDVVRSSYPKKFRDFMKGILTDILQGTPNKIVSAKIVAFKETMKDFELEDIAKNTSVKFISNTEAKINFDPKDRAPFNFEGGSTAQCKAALAYNDMLRKYELNDTEPILHGGKIKWVYLKENPFGLSGIAFKDDGKDPKIIMDFIHRYIHRTKIWDAELEGKLVDFYTAMRWDMYSENAATIEQFFSF
jgi:DNA polymerase elongation subunit (family B)